MKRPIPMSDSETTFFCVEDQATCLRWEPAGRTSTFTCQSCLAKKPQEEILLHEWQIGDAVESPSNLRKLKRYQLPIPSRVRAAWFCQVDWKRMSQNTLGGNRVGIVGLSSPSPKSVLLFKTRVCRLRTLGCLSPQQVGRVFASSPPKCAGICARGPRDST